MDLDEIAREVVASNPLALDGDHLVVAIRRACVLSDNGGVSAKVVHDAVKRARADARAASDRALLARLRRQQRPNDPSPAG